LALQLSLAAYRQFQGSTRAQTDRCEMTKIEHRTQYAVAMIATMALLVTVACSGAATGIVADAVGPDGLTSFQREHGVGPLTKPVDVSASVDKTLAASGAKLFEQKCSAHADLRDEHDPQPAGDGAEAPGVQKTPRRVHGSDAQSEFIDWRSSRGCRVPAIATAVTRIHSFRHERTL
jgi:hypothetical protein